jgi:alpha-tubulin suppressor-like RCC1 family protein
VAAAAADWHHTCAALLNGSLRCWGNNSHGQLGNGTLSSSAVPVAVRDFTGAVAVGCGERHSCALSSAGVVRCWGDNTDGQLGDGTFVGQRVPSSPVGY